MMHVRGCVCDECLNPGSVDVVAHEPGQMGFCPCAACHPWLKPAPLTRSEMNARAYMKRKLQGAAG